jgi:hypothetical protein
MITQEFEQWVLQHLAPEDTQENPAFPNHTDIDIWLVGFKGGYEYAVKHAIKNLFAQLEEFKIEVEKVIRNQNNIKKQ